MAGKASKSAAPELGRKGAYVLRNRAALLKATQQVLASTGPTATIDEIADHAQMSVSTIYKHFENKDVLFSAAVQAAFADWEVWAKEIAKNYKDELELLVVPMRLFVRMNTTHPLYAQMVSKNFQIITFIVPVLAVGMELRINGLVKSKVLHIEDVPLRISNLTAILASAIQNKLMDPKFSTADADGSIKIGLELLGISESKLKKLFEIKLPI